MSYQPGLFERVIDFMLKKSHGINNFRFSPRVNDEILLCNPGGWCYVFENPCDFYICTRKGDVILPGWLFDE